MGARLFWEQEVASSTLATPTTLIFPLNHENSLALSVLERGSYVSETVEVICYHQCNGNQTGGI